MPTPIESLLPRTVTRALPLSKGEQLYAALDLNGPTPKTLMLISAKSRRDAIEVFLSAGPVRHLTLEEPHDPKAIKRELLAMIEDGTQFAVIKLGRQIVTTANARAAR